MSEVVSKVRAWLESQGYPLEMAVARALTRQRFGVALSTHYEDPITKTSRELDVLGIREVSNQTSTSRVVVCAECKLARAHPWVVFTTAGGMTLPADRTPLFLTSGGARARLMGILANSASPRLTFFGPSCVVGYSLTEAFTSGQDVPYQACMGAVSAAASFTPPGLVLDRSMRLMNLSVLAVPIVVIGGILLSASLKPDVSTPDIEVHEIQRAAVLWDHPRAGLTDRLVHVVTFAGLPSFLDELAGATEAFLEAVPAPPPSGSGESA